MISDVLISKLSHPVELRPGDILTVTHSVDDDRGRWDRVVHKTQLNVTGTWTHSILFKLNGQINHLIGNADTVAWIKSQATSVLQDNG